MDLRGKEELAKVYEVLGQFEPAVAIRKETLTARETKLPAADRAVTNAKERLGRSLLAAKRYQEALPILEAAYEKRIAAADAGTAAALGNLLIAKDRLNQRDLAEHHWAAWLALIEKLHTSDEPKLINAKAAFSRLSLEHGLNDRAMMLLPSVVAYRNVKEPEAWTTFTAQSMLGQAYLGKKKLSEAEPLLRSSWEGIAARQSQIPPASSARIREALARMIELEQALAKPTEATKWKAKLVEREKTMLLERE